MSYIINVYSTLSAHNLSVWTADFVPVRKRMAPDLCELSLAQHGLHHMQRAHQVAGRPSRSTEKRAAARPRGVSFWASASVRPAFVSQGLELGGRTFRDG